MRQAVILLRCHPIYRDALICQLVALLLTSMIDGVEEFVPFVMPAWLLWWIGLLLFVRFRLAPSKAELFFARVGLLLVFILVFVLGQ